MEFLKYSNSQLLAELGGTGTADNLTDSTENLSKDQNQQSITQK